MGYYFAIVECVRCQVTFTCNPNLVPSIRVNGIRQPLCIDCVAFGNKLKKEAGLPLFKVPKGAYEFASEFDNESDVYDIESEQI